MKRTIQYILLLTASFFAATFSAYSQQVYNPVFQMEESGNRLKFTTESTDVCSQEFTCKGSTQVNGVDFIYTQFQYKVGMSPMHISFNTAYSGTGYPRLIVIDPNYMCGIADFSPTATGHYFIPLERFFEETVGAYDPNATVTLDFIFFVVDEAHKNTVFTDFGEFYGYFPIKIPINGNFMFHIEASFEKKSTIPDLEVIDSSPDPGPLSADQSYIRTRTMTNKTGSTYLDKIVYFDGLGRPVQTVQAGITPSGEDLVTIQQYDAFSRESRSWLPAPISFNNGAYVSPVTVMSKANETYNNDNKPYSNQSYEDSPVERVQEQCGPGVEWSEKRKAIRTEYLTNRQGVDTLNCIEYIIENTYTDTLINIHMGAYFPDGKLDVIRTENEDGNTTFEFRNKQGQVILNRQVFNNGAQKQLLDTYYIYDEPGNLRAVLPPMAADAMQTTAGIWTNASSEPLRQYAYLYEYDMRNRCIAKRLPGTQWIRYIYDQADRIIFSQDGVQRQNGEWAFSIPDSYGRVVLTGTCKNNINPVSEPLSNLVVKAKEAIGSSGTLSGYQITGVTLTSPTILTANYYDSYRYLTLPEFSGAGLSYTTSGIATEYLTRYGSDAASDYYKHKGLQTGSIMGVFSSSDVSYLYSAVYYDRQKRPIQSRSTSPIGGVISEYTAYNFTGQPLKRTLIHSGTGSTSVTQKNTYTYDHAGRKIAETTALNGGSESKTTYTYDQLGRSVGRQCGTNAPILTEQTSYNIRGWITSKACNQFSMQLRYNTPQMPGTTSSYSGNITEWEWKHTGNDVANSATNTYAFTYDKLSRLTETKQYLNGTLNNRQVEKGITYDLNGNIKTLQRFAAGTQSDNLTYTYSGNQLTALAGTTSGSYTYDANGNMTQDGPNNLSLTYNRLNLTEKVDRNGTTVAKYAYLSDGSKVSATDAAGNGLVYVGSLVFEKQNGVLSLESAGFGDGRFVKDGTSYQPNYFITDHLGSTRVVVDANGNVQERSDYYPYGLRWENGNELIISNRYRYNGKEEQGFLNVPYSDYGARMYDQHLGRWFNVDLMLENHLEHGPYVFCGNNPIGFVDRDGMDYNYHATKYFNQDGDLIKETNDNFPNRVVVVPNDELSFFLEQLKLTDDNLLNSDGWNNYWVERFGEYEISPLQNTLLDLHYSKDARNKAIGYLINPSSTNFARLAGSELLAQWTNPYLLTGNAAVGINALSGLSKSPQLQYSSRVRIRGLQDPVSHNFPYSYDRLILNTAPRTLPSGYKIYRMSGTMNGKQGVFEIGVNQNGVIDHRFFRPK